jgi:hypothetical protein
VRRDGRGRARTGDPGALFFYFFFWSSSNLNVEHHGICPSRASSARRGGLRHCSRAGEGAWYFACIIIMAGWLLLDLRPGAPSMLRIRGGGGGSEFGHAPLHTVQYSTVLVQCLYSTRPVLALLSPCIYRYRHR